MKQNVLTFGLFGTIDTNCLPLLMTLRLESQKDPNAVFRLVISSEGGDEDVGYALFDTLRALPNKIIVEGYGQVSSIAALIFQAGDERLLSPHCTYMMHNGSVDLKGDVDFDELEAMAEHYKNNNMRYYKAIGSRCKLPVDKIKTWCKDEVFFTAQEAVKQKLADGITEKI